MQVTSKDDLEKVGQLLAQSDFDQGDLQLCSGENSFTLKTTRPGKEPKKGGLLRQPDPEWIPAQLTLRGVESVKIWELDDAPAEMPPLIQVESVPSGFLIHLASPKALRVDLVVGRLEGELS